MDAVTRCSLQHGPNSLKSYYLAAESLDTSAVLENFGERLEHRIRFLVRGLDFNFQGRSNRGSDRQQLEYRTRVDFRTVLTKDIDGHAGFCRDV